MTSYELDLEKKIEERSKIGFKRLAEYLREKGNMWTFQNMPEEFQGIKEQTNKAYKS